MFISNTSYCKKKINKREMGYLPPSSYPLNLSLIYRHARMWKQHILLQMFSIHTNSREATIKQQTPGSPECTLIVTAAAVIPIRAKIKGTLFLLIFAFSPYLCLLSAILFFAVTNLHSIPFFVSLRNIH